jgi:integrase
MHRRIAVMFGNWLERVKRLPANPVGGKRVKLAKGPKKRKRRALAVEEVRRLLAAAEERPLASARVNKGGRGAQGRPGGVPAKPKAATEARLRRAGRERRLLYRLALLTGLRRGELERLRVHHLDLARGWLALPGELTKNGKPAQLPLLAGLAGELREWFAAEGKGPDDPVVYVPAESNLARIHKANLKHAGIPYVTAAGAADFHALRKCTNTLLRLAGVPAKERQLFLRHHKLELTTETYDDETRADLGKAARALECLGI